MDSINPVLQDMILQRKLSPRKVRNLAALSRMVDRLAGRPYLKPEVISDIEGKYGVKPDLLTWGDWFQSSLADAHWEKPDEEFSKLIQTVVFDIISAALIFTGKDMEFLDNIQLRSLSARAQTQLDPAGHEDLHLGVLLEYFRELGLDSSRLTDEDMEVFTQFTEAAVS